MSRRKPRLVKKRARARRAPTARAAASAGAPTVQQLIERYALEPHAEGGFFRETFRSRTIAVTRYPDGAQRSGLTTILFLLPANAVSRWHRVASDESWHFHSGAPLELFGIDGETACIRARQLGPESPVLTVPAGEWQAARSTGAYTLVSCSVGPGFDFADFVLMSHLDAAERPRIVSSDLERFETLI